MTRRGGGRQHGTCHMAIHVCEGARFEAVTSEFVFEFLVLLLDGAALMRELHQDARRAGRR